MNKSEQRLILLLAVGVLIYFKTIPSPAQVSQPTLNGLVSQPSVTNSYQPSGGGGGGGTPSSEGGSSTTGGATEQTSSGVTQSIQVPISISLAYGSSNVQAKETGLLSVLSGSQAITGVTAKATITPSGVATISNASGTMSLLFDGASKKTAQLTTSGATITATADEITAWDNGAYTSHTLTAQLPSGSVTVSLSSGGSESATISPASSSLCISVTSTPPASSSDYTLSVSGITIKVTNKAGTQILSGTDFGAICSTLNSKLVQGDTIYISPGTYLTFVTQTAGAVFTVPNIIITGSRGTIIKAGTAKIPSTSMFLLMGNYETAKGITFDSNHNAVISPSVCADDGSYITIEGCTFLNANQYCLEAYSASYFTFTNNTITTAQYGICTAGQSNAYSTNGIVSYNTIKDCSDVGIKIKWTKSTVFQYNTIDTAFITQPNNLRFNPSGIRYYHDDGPTNDVTVSNNIIIDSNPTSLQHTAGVFVDNDKTGLSTGETIIGNQITGCYFGVYNNWNYVVIENNVFTSCSYPIIDNGLYTVISGNTIN